MIPECCLMEVQSKPVKMMELQKEKVILTKNKIYDETS